MAGDLLTHPLATSEWESLPAATVRLHTRSVWARPEADEQGAPPERIIHLRAILADEPLRLREALFPLAAGYHKCASGQEVDAALRARLWAPDQDGWRQVAALDRTAESARTAEARIDLADLSTTALVTEIREALTDRWWPGWNLATTGIRLDGDAPAAWHPRRQENLSVTGVDLTGLPEGVTAEHRNGEVRFRTPWLSVGFRLKSAAWAHLGLDDDGQGRHERNLLQLPRSMDIVRSGVYPSGVYPVLRDQNAEYLAQGPRLTTHTGDRPVGFLASDVTGTTTVTGATVVYELAIPSAGQRYRYEFTVGPRAIRLRLRRVGERAVRAWTSSAWHVATDNRVTPSTALGRLTRRGETGIMTGPVTWHFPRYGSLTIEGTGDPVLVRSDSVRALDTNTLELKLDEEPTDFGDYLLPAGTFEADVVLRAGTPRLARVEGAPEAVERMLARHAATALPFRADTATYSNNGASMHCTTTLGDVSAIALRLSPLPSGEHPMDLVGLSLERWLAGAPSYGSGATSHGTHRLEDEYVHMAANTLAALGRYLRWQRDPAWFEAHRGRIIAEVVAMLARDVDGDGLAESTIRLGNTGEHQWSTAWSDVISFGWKDAWANAVLFEAWGELAPALETLGETELAARVREAAARLQESYLPTFLNEETGLVAGWRSQDGELHDHGFSLVVGAACASELIPVARARTIMERLLEHWNLAGLDEWRNGVPLNLWRVPEEEIGGVVFGLPMGGYQQGGFSHHGARVIVDALHRVGLTAEGDRLLEALAATIADDSSFGGLGTGVDWRMADGTPSGYEGQLAEGFSVLASALTRYGGHHD